MATESHAIENRGVGRDDFDLARYLGAARRRFGLFLITALVVFGAGYWIAMSLPPVYQAAATILVESQQIPTALAQSTVTANADERIQIIKQRLMTRDNLLAIARKYSLYADQSGRSPSDIVDLTRRATVIQQIDVGSRVSPTTTAIGFTVSFKDSDANAAAKVANEFVTSILEQNIRARTTRAAETSRFFDDQVEQLRKDLVAQEARIVEFKNQNQGSLPETFTSRQSLFVQLQGQAADIRSRMSIMQSQRQFLANQESPSDAPTSTEAQLAQLRVQLFQLRAVYADTHPEVRAAVAKIDALEKAAQSGTNSGGAPAKDNKTGGTRADAARISELDAQLTTLNGQFAEIDQRSAALDTSLQRTPQIEVALNVLVRDYDSLQAQYRAAQTKAVQASTGEQLEQDKQAERFEVLEQATVPSAPTDPDRGRLTIAAAFVAAAMGMGMAALAEILDQSVRGVADLERKLNRRPLASIPFVVTARERRRKGYRRVFALFAVVFLVAVGLLAVQTYYLPLELIAQRLIRGVHF